MDGVLVIDKPAGPTSHDVVAEIRKALDEPKVGHTGTLDPAATGVLPLVLGKATKLARFLTGSDKEYEATVRLGITTDTLDAVGEVVAEHPVDTDEVAVRCAVTGFLGEIEQVPPMYSAKKVDGKKLYELARAGVEIEREAKKVRVHAIEVLRCELPEVVLRVRCSAGTYVRVLAQELGGKLGCGAHLARLRRTQSGPFGLADALPLDAAIANPDTARARLLPLTRALETLPRIDVPPGIARMVAAGYQLTVADLRTLDTPSFNQNDMLTLGVDDADIVAVVCAQLASCDLGSFRRDFRALKTERVVGRG